MNNQNETNQPLFDESQLIAFAKPSDLVDSLGKVLSVLDVEIGMAEKAYIRHRDSLIFRMASLGKLYAQKKIDLGHGNFANWIKSRELLTQTEVVRCLKVHEEFPDGKFQIRHGVPNLSKKTILEIIYSPEEVKTEIKERLEAGETVTRNEVVELKQQAKAGLPVKPKKPAEVKRKDSSSLGKVEDDIIEGVFEEVIKKPAVPVEPSKEYHEEYTEADNNVDLLRETLERNEYLESLYIVFEDDNHTSAALEEIRKLKLINRGLESSNNGLLNENAAMKRQLNNLERQNKALRKKHGPVDNSSSDQPPERLSCDEPDLPDWFSDDGYNEEIGAFK